MPHLIAQGESPQHRWRRHLAPGRDIKIGRAAAGWAVPWDDRVSRLHARITLDPLGLFVQKLPDARNPIFYQGKTCDAFHVQIGEHFVIGSTTFSLVDEQLDVTSDAPLPLTELTYSPRQLESRPFLNAAREVDAISRLPDIIATAATEKRSRCDPAERLARSRTSIINANDAAAAKAQKKMCGTRCRPKNAKRSDQ